MRAIGKNPTLADILEKIRTSEGKYISAHFTMTAFIACGIASAIHWNSEGTFYKLNLAAFLHDITLDNQELAAVPNLRELEKKKDRFSPDELRKYKIHTIKAAEIAREFQEVPPDVDTIIVQHHERPDGTGFPRGLRHTHIAPLAALFIIAHDFVQYAYGKPDANLGEFLKLNENYYVGGNFKKVARTMAIVGD